MDEPREPAEPIRPGSESSDSGFEPTKPFRPPPPPEVPSFEGWDEEEGSAGEVFQTEEIPLRLPPEVASRVEREAAAEASASEKDAPEIPPLEEITFELRSAAPPAVGEAGEPSEEAIETVTASAGEPVRIPAARPSRPRSVAPRTLSKRRFATLEAFAEALIPPGGAIPFSASEVGVAERIDAALGDYDRDARRAVERALTWWEWSAAVSRHLRPYSRLNPGAAAALLERARRGRLFPRRAAADLLRSLCLNQWAATSPVEEAVGYTYSCLTGDPPRPADPLEVVSYPQVDRDHREECDVVVVGSGAGGAVVAKELAEIGLSVVVLEEGGHFTRTDFAGPPFERVRRLYRSQGIFSARGSTSGGSSIDLPMGRGIGGSTLVGYGTCLRAADRVLARWEKDLGIPGVDPESMRPFFERVERIQRVKAVPPELLGESARVFGGGARQLGLHAAPAPRAIEGCRGCGVCTFGCPTDALLSTRLTYLPRAQRHGAGIYANARAERILIEDGRARGVTAALLDPRTREPKATLTVRAKVVIVAAGAVHTPALLSENALGNRSGQLGRNLRLRPFASVHGVFDQEIFAWRGTQQPLLVDDWRDSHDLMVAVSSMPPSVAAGTLTGDGLRLKDMVARSRNLASANVFVSDTSTGRVDRRSGGEPAVTYRLNEHDTRRLVRGIAHAAEIFLAAGARAALTGLPGAGTVGSKAELSAIAEEAVRARDLRLTGAQPTGTARMGTDPAESVVDPWGEVHGVPGLFVADGSVLPGSPGVDPQVTIMAFATRTADHLARHGSRYF